MSDRLRELMRTAERVQREVRAFEHARTTLREEVEASDRQAAVTVVLDPDGRVRTIRPARQWADRVPAEELGAAVFEAIQLAQGRRMERWVELAEQAPEPPPVSSTPGPATTGPTTAEPPLVDLPTMVGDLLRLFDGLGAAQQPSAQEPAEPDTDSVGSKPVRVVLGRSGEPAEVHVSARWASALGADTLGRRLTAAFEEAYEAYDDAPTTHADGEQVSPELEAVMADPVGVFTRYTQSILDNGGTSAVRQ
jgi:DNA-binding protein YbaB